MAVTKNFSYKAINSAIANNIFLIGENKIQETEKKITQVISREKIKLHFIGTIQSNKIKTAVQIYDVIETVSSEKHLLKIQKEAKKINKKQKIYFQINIGKDPKKGGVLKKELLVLLKQTPQALNVEFQGLMTILPQNTKKNQQTRLYEKMKALFNQIQKEYPSCINLSMGMSNDFEQASKAGATHVRIGTKLYGQR